MIVFLSGPMSGYKDFNYPAFQKEAAKLRALGHIVHNPAENPAPPCGTWEGYMRLSIAQLMRCKVVRLLPGWEASRGARIEVRTARDLDMMIIRPDA